MSEAFVLDASAVLCLLKGEKGTDRVIEVLPRSFISAVNLSEVYAKLADAGGSEQQLAHAVTIVQTEKVTERAYRRSCVTQKELGSHPELEIP